MTLRPFGGVLLCMIRACIPAVIMLLASCSFWSTEPGCTYTGQQIASARAFYPDTGFTAGTEVVLLFAQRNPYGVAAEAELVIAHLWPPERGLNPEPYPRVRLVLDQGQVLLDTLAWRTTASSWSWGVIHILEDAELRNTMFAALQNEALWIELWLRDAVQPAIRLRLHTESAEVLSIPRCA